MELIPLPPPFPLLPKEGSSNNLPKSENTKGNGVAIELDTVELWIKLNGKINDTFMVVWQNTPTILQNGPQCGLVALAMAAQSHGQAIDTDSIFQKALNMGITKKGELFSSFATCELATCIEMKPLLLNDGFHDAEVLLRYLISDKMLLVPYDADCNHAPCLKNGHKAHWALLIGVLFQVDNSFNHNNGCCSRELLRQNIYRISDVHANCDLPSQVDKENIYFLAKHGKSKRLAIWSYNSLQASNNNLQEVDPKRVNDLEYVLPPNNNLADLRDKVIVLR
ncbi:UPF0692 protein C19orf54 homolog [Daphnia magna]|uniref:Uncharacterized protein n=3 Tax=Daphnia magna TaxID=35525 RepID=A0ABQ9ZAC2_9CRUS|nr:UPF0692 protein C19orf54 homolog [Daphnia magna]KAK4009825.1 hypothetical protein OUZ56_018972 [Daphnia magna]KZS19855.1 putative UPF0692 protein [Daphnia magna]